MAASAKVYRRGQVAAKLETTEGTAISLAAADANIRAHNIQVRMRAQMTDRPIAAAELGAWPSALEGEQGEISFEVEASGSGTAGTAPGFSALLRSGGCSETVVASTSVTYAPVSPQGTGASACPSATVSAFLDGDEYRLAGCRTFWTLKASAGGKLMIAFRVIGKFAAATTTALLSPTYHTTLPLMFKGATMTLNSVTLVVSEFELDPGLQHELREDGTDATGFKSAAFVDRESRLRVVAEKEPFATFDPFALAQAGTQFVFGASFGATAGNRLAISAPRCQLDFPEIQRLGARVGKSLSMRLCRNTGNDEFSLVYT